MCQGAVAAAGNQGSCILQAKAHLRTILKCMCLGVEGGAAGAFVLQLPSVIASESQGAKLAPMGGDVSLGYLSPREGLPVEESGVLWGKLKGMTGSRAHPSSLTPARSHQALELEMGQTQLQPCQRGGRELTFPQNEC